MTQTRCNQCGMMTAPGEFHPFAACLMFRACEDPAMVRVNLRAVAYHNGGTTVRVPRIMTTEMFQAFRAAAPEADLLTPHSFTQLAPNVRWAAALDARPGLKGSGGAL